MNKYIYFNDRYIPRNNTDAKGHLLATLDYVLSSNHIASVRNKFCNAYIRCCEDLEEAINKYSFDDLFIDDFYQETAVKYITQRLDTQTQIDPLSSPIYYFDKQILSLSKSLSYFSLKYNLSADVRDVAYLSALRFIDNYIIIDGFDDACKFVKRHPETGDIIGVGDLNININRLAEESLNYAFDYVYKKRREWLL